MKSLITAALLLTSGFTFAQNNTAPTPAPTPAPVPAPGEVKQLEKDIHADKKTIREDKQALRASRQAERAQLKDLDAQEKAKVDAIKASPLTPDQKKTAIADAQKDFKTRRTTVKSQFEAQRKSDDKNIHAERHDIKTDRKEIKAIDNSKK